MLFYLPSLISPGDTGGLQMFTKDSFSKKILISLLVLFSLSLFVNAEEIKKNKKDVPQTENQEIQKPSETVQSDDQEKIKTEEQKKEKINKKKYKSEGIIITATKNEIDKRETGASVSIITGEEIAESGKNFVSDVLRTIPGVDVISSGPLGSTTLVGIRGANPKNVLVLIDGVPVNDPIGGGGNKTFDFANFPTENIERIEIIRGPNSVLYGSESAAGVINIITKKGEGKPEFHFNVEGGSYLTFKETAIFTASNSLINFSLTASRTDSEGMTKRSNSDGSITGLENDPFHNTAVSSRTKVKILESVNLDFNIHYINSETATDETSGDSRFPMFYNELFSSGLAFNQSISFWDHKLSLSYSSSNTKNFSYPDAGYYYHSYFNGINKKIEWLNNFNINTEYIKNIISLGLNASNEKGSSLYFSNEPHWSGTPVYTVDTIPEIEVTSIAVYIQNHFKLFDTLFFIAGGRYEYNQLYKSEFNYNFSVSGIIPVIETRIKGNIGSGFKAPTIYQLYSSYGSRTLLPEKNFSFDAGFEQPFFKGIILFSIVYFNSQYTNMIKYDTNTSKFNNIGKAYMQGLESELTLKLPDNINISTGYTFTKATEGSSDAQSIRNPMHKVFAKFNWSFLKRGNINITYTYNSESADTVSSVYKYNANAPYHKLDLAASFWIIDSIQIFAKIDNLTDSTYQQAYGYAMPGLNASGGITVKL